MTIQQSYKKFKTQVDCIKYLEQIKWGGIPRCPHCNTTRQTPQLKEQRYRCGVCRSSYSVTVRTVFHNTKIDLQKWFVAIPLILNKRISARQLAKEIGVTKDTACFMVNRIIVANKDQPDLIQNLLK